MLFYRAALPLSHQTLTFVARLVRTHRREIGSPWRSLVPAQQALYVTETVELLAQRTETTESAAGSDPRWNGLRDHRRHADPDRPGRRQIHGMNLRMIASPDGTILWVSGDLPGSTHDTAAARIWTVLAASRDAGLVALATATSNHDVWISSCSGAP
jgi:hypothetical protein